VTIVAGLLAAVIGTMLGLFGGGGAILTVPIFVYVLGVPVKSAVPMSLFVIGTACAVGAAGRWMQGTLDPRKGLLFGLSAMVGAFCGARIGLLIPARLQLLLFASAVIAASAGMLRSSYKGERAAPSASPLAALSVPALIGTLTGIVGIGGGFLFVPALVALFSLPMSTATGLSLMVIAMNAAAGIGGYQGRIEIDWSLATGFATVVVGATLVAGRLAPKLPERVLKRAFASVLLVVGLFVLLENLR